MSNRHAEITRRIAAINLRQYHLAELAGLDPTTICRTLKGRSSPLVDTMDKTEKALGSEEIRIARHLLALPHVRAALEAEAKAGAAPSSTAVRDCA